MDNMKEFVNKFIESNYVLKGLAQANKEDVATALTEWLEQDNQLRYYIHNEIERRNHKQDVLNEIDYRNEELEDENQIHFTDEELELITENYECALSDDESWHFILNNEIDNFLNKEDNQ
jgi:maltodextrin utilization protein YvdJ